nr:MAG TPA: hypothetical protein [Caudoviricetes sp.]
MRFFVINGFLRIFSYIPGDCLLRALLNTIKIGPDQLLRVSQALKMLGLFFQNIPLENFLRAARCRRGCIFGRPPPPF